MIKTLDYINHKNYIEIIFHNPNSRNSFGLEEAKSLNTFIKNNPNSIILFRSSLKNIFCSGGNLKFYASKTKKESIKANRIIRKTLEKLSKHKNLTIALVDGDCIGGGMELLSCFDYIISSPNSLFALWQRKIGLSYGWGGGARLKKRIGEINLKNYSLNTKSLDAYTAKEIGLVDIVLQSKEEKAYVTKYINKFQSMPQIANDYFKFYNEKKEASFFEKIWANKDHKKKLLQFRFYTDYI